MVDRFTPQTVSADCWVRVRPFVVAAVGRVAARDEQEVRNLLNVVTQLAVWVDTVGQPLTSDVVFDPDTVDRFISEGCAHLSPGTQANYRALLRIPGRAVLGTASYPPQAVAFGRDRFQPPYTPAEVGELAGWARGRPTVRMRRNLGVLLAASLGAGLTASEIQRLVGSDVVRDADGVTIGVGGRSPRRVPVLAAWEGQLFELAAGCGDSRLFLSERHTITRHDVGNFIEDCDRPPVPLVVQRLRVTWIVTHLNTRIPLAVLADAAGVQPTQLAQYVRFADPMDPGVARKLLRGAGH